MAAPSITHRACSTLHHTSSSLEEGHHEAGDSDLVRTLHITSVFWKNYDKETNTLCLAPAVYEFPYDCKPFSWVYEKSSSGEVLTAEETSMLVHEIVMDYFSTLASERGLKVSKIIFPETDSVTVGLGLDRRTVLLYAEGAGAQVELKS